MEITILDTCLECGNQVWLEDQIWIDDSGNDVCGAASSKYNDNETHTPSGDETMTIIRRENN
jgi:hypothetical protein